MKILLTLLMLFSFLGGVTCHGDDAKPKGDKSTPTTNAKTWAGLEISGLILDLQDEKDVLWLSFNRDGFVAVTFGRKEGGLAAPLCSWRVSGEWMQIFEDSRATKLWFQMRVLKRTDKMLTAENGAGEKQVFAIKKQ